MQQLRKLIFWRSYGQNTAFFETPLEETSIVVMQRHANSEWQLRDTAPATP
ncbi:hypothetical protein LHK_01272 [Laribacter hongkongensis HLHK9]|uniref:Uncharacterized protein n=1 Tax=Laribacter hongkongensis (strain HLHK9) TaxID=557598 RepID=C1D722_LARHH|nr:hypothetical protein LHK_01272 [Laribacter hongkongensis HLHK9]